MIKCDHKQENSTTKIFPKFKKCKRFTRLFPVGQLEHHMQLAQVEIAL